VAGFPVTSTTGSAGTPLSSPSSPAAGKYPNLHRAIADVLNGAQDRTILFVGDSHTYGYTSVIGPFSQTLFSQMVTFFSSMAGVTAQQGLIIPPGSTSSTLDARWTVAGTWSIAGTLATPRGWGGLASATSTNLAAFTSISINTAGLKYAPATSCDTFDVYYIDDPLNGTFQINIDGGANTTVGPSTSGIKKVTITGAVASNHVLNFNLTNIQFGVYIIGVDARLSTTPTLRLGNAGVNGSFSTGWASTGAVSASACITTYAPDVTVVCIGGNDIIVANPNTTAGQYITNLTTIANTAKLSGDVIFCGLVAQSPTAFTPNANPGLQSLNATVQSWAIGQGFGFIDLWDAWGGIPGQATLQTLGYYDAGGIEFTNRGYADRARILVQGLLAL
jgi:lysophospholipase L1-like esterase